MKRYVSSLSLVLVASILQVNAAREEKPTFEKTEFELAVLLDGKEHKVKVNADTTLDKLRSDLSKKAECKEKLLFEDDFGKVEAMKFHLQCLANYDLTVGAFIAAQVRKDGDRELVEVFNTWLKGDKDQKVRAYTPTGLHVENKTRQKKIGEGIKELAAALKECGIDSRDQLDATYVKELEGVFSQVGYSRDASNNASLKLPSAGQGSEEGQERGSVMTNPYLLGLGGVAAGAASMYAVNRVLLGRRSAVLDKSDFREAAE